MFKKITLIFFTIFTLIINLNTYAHRNNEAEFYISQMLERKVPYTVKLLDCEFTVKSNNVYYPDNGFFDLFVTYLSENNLIDGKVIVEVNTSCMPITTMVAKRGAKQAIGYDSNPDAVTAGRENAAANGVKDKVTIITGKDLAKSLAPYKGKVDVLFAKTPWDKLPQEQYDDIPEERKIISSYFYDPDNKTMTNIFVEGGKLLSKNGKIYIPAGDRVLPRIEEICKKTNKNYRIVVRDQYKNNNMHYIVEITNK